MKPEAYIGISRLGSLNGIVALPYALRLFPQSL